MNNLSDKFITRANRMLNLADFADGSVPIPVMECSAIPSVDNQYILRMMLRSPTHSLYIPPELEWMTPIVCVLDTYQRAHGLNNPFIYATVRHGIVDSVTDDAWHVDGFSMRTPHVPEQNYICAHGSDPTEYLIKDWCIPSSFDPRVHNIHHYFRDFGHDGQVISGDAQTVYAIDPYCVHRRPCATVGQLRTFWRLSFVPIEIEDDTCTPNPMFPPRKYNRTDIRKELTAWIP